MEYEVVKGFGTEQGNYPADGRTVTAAEIGPMFSVILAAGCLRAINRERRDKRELAKAEAS